MRAISVFRLEAGTSTFWCRARIALRMHASMSATGSVKFMVLLLLSRPFSPLSGEPATARTTQLCAHLSRVPCERVGTLTLLPGRLRNSRNFPAQCQPAETQAAQAKLAQIPPRPPANLAAIVLAGRKLWPRLLVGMRPILIAVMHLIKLRLDLRVLDSFCCS